jgi:hypothetical protein
VDEGAGDMYTEVSVLLIRLQDLVVLPSICVSVVTVTAPLLCLFLSSECILSKVVSLLKCQLSEGAVSDKNGVDGPENGAAHSGSDEHEEIEEGELPDSHGEPGCSNVVIANITCVE